MTFYRTSINNNIYRVINLNKSTRIFIELSILINQQEFYRGEQCLQQNDLTHFFQYLMGPPLVENCISVFLPDHYGNKLIELYDFLILFTIPVSAMLFAYISITVTLRRSIAQAQKMSSEK